MRKTELAQGEYYHVFNRGTDRRDIFQDTEDFQRFFQSMEEFNSVEPIGSIYESSFNKISKVPQLGHPMSKLRDCSRNKEKLVEFVAYCVNPNHFHFILEQITERGIEKFMQRFGNGYTKYFNGKYKRSGVLFQGKYKSIHVATNEYLLRLSAYVNLNDRVHNIPQLGHRMSKSSWDEYVIGENAVNHFCKKDIVLEQFNSPHVYKEFAEEALELILHNRAELKNIEYEK